MQYPGFTGKSPPRSPIRQNQPKGSKKSPRGSKLNSPKEKPRKLSTSPRDDKDVDKNVCRMWKATGTCKFGDKCKYSHDITTAVADEGEISMIAALHYVRWMTRKLTGTRGRRRT
eukprot:5284885-Amphidinium_carterae.1